MGGVVVAGLVVGAGGDVVGAGPRWFSVGDIGDGAGGGAAAPWSPAAAFGGAGTGDRAGDEGAGACAPAGPDAADVGVVLGRGSDPLPAPYMIAVTAANPTRNAATHAPTSSKRRPRAE
ncbi:MAG TPA: hypothetical protein VKH17_03395 [Acidimicrobiia bacterium]|nr:hypothetical protein [Acidimicrobiia bacterium]